MIAWGLFLAWSGQKYSAKRRSLSFREDLENSTLPWFTGASWGTATLSNGQVKIEIVEGQVEINEVNFQGALYSKITPGESVEGVRTRYFGR
jgi:hypothetical protein